MKKITKTAALLLSILMVFSLFQTIAFADDGPVMAKIKADGKLGRGAKRRFVKIPYIAAETVLHSVSEHKTENVLPAAEHTGQIVNVVVEYIVGI